jgi:Coenzyme PQQ synthesis protein D (PqqD)
VSAANGARPKRCIEVEVRRTSDAIFIARDTEQRELSEVAALIWRLSNGKRTVAEIVATVCDSYDVDTTTAQRDTMLFLEDLAKDRFIAWETDEQESAPTPPKDRDGSR